MPVFHKTKRLEISSKKFILFKTKALEDFYEKE